MFEKVCPTGCTGGPASIPIGLDCPSCGKSLHSCKVVGSVDDADRPLVDANMPMAGANERDLSEEDTASTVATSEVDSLLVHPSGYRK